MSNTAYKLGFILKMAELNKSALSEAAKNALRSYNLEQDKKNGLPTRVVRKPPTTFGETLKYKGQRAMDYLGSTGRGLASALGVTGVRALQGGTQVITGIPGLADKLIFGSLMGIDEGRGLLGRRLGKMNRAFDSKVHSLRKWVDDYDYKYRLNNKLNRLLNGAVADTAGSFIGWGGLTGALGLKALNGTVPSKTSRLLGLGGGTFGAVTSLLGGPDKELRDREAMIRKLRPRARIYVDPTSTPTNQANAPTLEEYRRYHTPQIPDLPTSVTGYINVPRNWWYTSSGAPIQTRDFGT